MKLLSKTLTKEPLIISLLLFLFITTIFLSLKSQKEPSALALSRSTGIGLIEINGPIAFEMRSTAFSAMGASHILDQIHALKKDDAVKGILIRINSPGGTVGASQEIYNALLALKKDRKIPIVVSIADVGASGAYYVALAGDTIYANPGSLIGSIGVLIGNINYSELAKKHGVYLNLYKSGPYKDILSSWRASTDAENQLLNRLIQDVYGQFVAAVAEQRQLSPQITRELAQGQIYTGKAAKTHQLIDQLGGYNVALTALASQVGIKGDPTIIKKDKLGFTSFLSAWKDQLSFNWQSLIFPTMTMTY